MTAGRCTHVQPARGGRSTDTDMRTANHDVLSICICMGKRPQGRAREIGSLLHGQVYMASPRLLRCTCWPLHHIGAVLRERATNYNMTEQLGSITDIILRAQNRVDLVRLIVHAVRDASGYCLSSVKRCYK
jgi:hypothetical protein